MVAILEDSDFAPPHTQQCSYGHFFFFYLTDIGVTDV